MRFFWGAAAFISLMCGAWILCLIFLFLFMNSEG